MKIKHALTILSVAAMLAANAVLAATSYVVPWYANPAVTNVAYSAAMVSSFSESAAPLSTAWATVASDANVSGQTIVAKRMSHTDYFRPRLYALRGDGTIVIYTLTENLSGIKWTTVLSSADLIVLVNRNGGSLATGQTVTGFEVVDKDGAIAYVQFGGSGDWTALANQHPKWTYYSANIDGNPSTGSVACITDGRWILKSEWKNSAIQIGNYTTSNIAYDGGYMGEFLDLCDGVTTAASNGAKWDIAQFVYGLKADANGISPRVIIHSSKLVNQDSPAGFQTIRPEELVIDAAGITKLAKWSRPSDPEFVKKLVLNLSGLRTIAETGFGYDSAAKTIGEESGGSDINFPALTHVGENGLAGVLANGSLELPSIVAISNKAFYGCNNLSEVKLSAAGNTLAYLGNWTFNAMPNTVGSLKRVTLGCAEGFAFTATAAFSRQPLEVVTFTGAVPLFSVAGIWPDSVANTMVFVIPEGVAAWDAIVSEATPLTEAERKAYHAAHPDHPIPFGTVAASVFKSHYSQYIAYIGSDKDCSLTVERDTFFNDTVSVSSDWAPFADGTYPRGAVVTLTATPNATGSFRKWYGDVENDACSNNTITVTVSGDKWLYARFVHPWTLSSDKATLANGNFTVRCSVVNESKRTLQVGVDWGRGLQGLFANDDGIGILDLGGRIAQAGDSGEWTIVRLPAGSGSCASPAGDKVTGFISPGTLAMLPSNSSFTPFQNVGASYGFYRTIIVDEPTAPWQWSSDWYASTQWKLEHLILQIPQLTSISGTCALNGAAGLSGTRLDWWNLDGVTAIGENSLRIDSSNIIRIPTVGILSLPSYRSVAGAEFQYMANVEGFVLGGKDKATTVTNIAANAFAFDTTLKRLVLHASADIVVGATPFSNGRTPDEIVFTGAPPSSSTAFANLFGAVTSGDTPRLVRILKGTQAWQTAGYIDHIPTAAEKALAGDEADKVFGVYRGSDGGVSFVKAVCVWDEPIKGLRLIIR